MTLRTWLTHSLDRILGSSVELESESFTELSTRAVCPVDHSLIERQQAKRAELDALGIGIKARAEYINAMKAAEGRLIEPQPDIPTLHRLPDDDFA